MELKEAIKKIKNVEVQGATQIAIFALEFLLEYSKKHGFGKKFFNAIKQIEKTRPTGVVLHNALKIVKSHPSETTIRYLIQDIKTARKLLAEKAYKFIPFGAKILTHCHSGDALAVIKKAHQKGRKIEVIATITEPLHQGIRTAKELKKEGIKVLLIEDNAAGYFMKDVDMVIIGSDSIRKEGIINKIGSLMLACVAKYYKKPFLVFSTSYKIDERRLIKIEERPKAEIISKDPELKKLKVNVRNPAFDLVPWNLIEMVVTEKEVMFDFNKRVPLE